MPSAGMRLTGMHSCSLQRATRVHAHAACQPPHAEGLEDSHRTDMLTACTCMLYMPAHAAEVMGVPLLQASSPCAEQALLCFWTCNPKRPLYSL